MGKVTDHGFDASFKAALAKHPVSGCTIHVGEIRDGVIRVGLVDDETGKYLLLELTAAGFLEFEVSDGYRFIAMDDDEDGEECLFEEALQAFDSFRRGDFVIRDGWWRPQKYMDFDSPSRMGRKNKRERTEDVASWVRWPHKPPRSD